MFNRVYNFLLLLKGSFPRKGCSGVESKAKLFENIKSSMQVSLPEDWKNRSTATVFADGCNSGRERGGKRGHWKPNLWEEIPQCELGELSWKRHIHCEAELTFKVTFGLAIL